MTAAHLEQVVGAADVRFERGQRRAVRGADDGLGAQMKNRVGGVGGDGALERVDVLEPEVLDYIDDDDTIFERGPLARLARDGQLAAYRHEGFWQCMDTLRDVRLLNALWSEGRAPWAAWMKGVKA